ncbi:hypothetical protein Tco_0212419 [Tanacetum coccineum]
MKIFIIPLTDSIDDKLHLLKSREIMIDEVTKDDVNDGVEVLWTDAKYMVDQTQSTRLRYRSLRKNKGETSSEVEPNNQTLLLSTAADAQALLLSDEELMKESEDDVFKAGDEMDEDIHHIDEE